MWEYLSDWKIWVMCIVVVAIIECTDRVWAEEPPKTWTKFEYVPEKPKSETIDFRPVNNLRFKWKFNRVEGKYQIVKHIDFRTNFVVDDNMNIQATSLFTLEF